MTSPRPRQILLVLGIAAALATSIGARAGDTKDAVKLDSDALEGITARAIGPAAMSGRIAAIDGSAGERITLWVGSASGGVWKSVDGGISFKPVFDKYTQSIGAIAVDPSNPNTVWVGTGESWVRNSVSVGTGVYNTRDGGETWQLAGLSDSEHISRIVIHPKDSNTVLVCALGHLWNSNAERGVFRSTDAGKNWQKVLFVNDDTGCSDLVVDRQDPSVLYAGMWQVRRTPWTFSSGGLGSGLYKSSDGGATWRRVTKGLPEGVLGRIGLAVAASRPNVVYALVEAKKTALFRSDDLGESWREMNSSFNIQGRPFYFASVIVDPKDFNRVYKPGYDLTISEDGGKTFGGSARVHGDLHALWINPKDTEQLYVGTDGGLYISLDRGAHWRFAGTLPVSQFYHVSYDLEQPYNVYGGLQDNGSWMGPSRHAGGVSNRHWRNIGIGDGFWAFVDPTDPDIAYVEYQGGRISRMRKSSGESKRIRPAAPEGQPELRFNWNTPIHISPTRVGLLYIGAQYLFRSRDRGESWERISPDLTSNDPAKLKQEESGGVTVDNTDAEKHCTIYTISESPKNPDVIWAGTDDGNLQVTRDGGKTWSNVIANVSGLPANTWVSYVDAGHFDEGTAYVTFDGHASGDMKPYVYRTRDFGKTWQGLTTSDLSGYAHVVREDRIKPNLLFLGTEFGLFISIDGGESWAHFLGNLPQVAVRDIAVHPRENDLILATHGRGVWIVDDITPLHSLTADVLASDVAFLPSRSSVVSVPAFEQRFDADDQFTGHSPENTAWIVYYLKKRHMFGDLRIEVHDKDGELVYSAPGGRRRGLNRFEWPMRLKPPKAPPATSLTFSPFSLVGPLVPEGTYSVKMIKGDKTYETQVQLVPDPRSPHSAEDRRLERETALKVYQLLGRLTYVVDATIDLRDQARQRAAQLPAADSLRKRVEALADSLESLRQTLVAYKETGGYTGEIRLREKMIELYGNVNGYEGRPTQTQLEEMSGLEHQLDHAAAQLDSGATKEVPALNPLLEKKKLGPLKPLSEEEWKKKDQKT